MATRSDARAAAARSRRASIHLACPGCDREAILAVAPRDAAAGEAPPEFTCDRCGFSLQFATSSPDPGVPLRRCALCGNEELYVQRDFNRKLGLWVVVVTAAIALLVMVRANHLYGLAVLAIVTLVDAAIFLWMGEVTVCYLCHTVYRGYPRRPDHGPFSLERAEHFKRERKRWLEGIADES